MLGLRGCDHYGRSYDLLLFFLFVILLLRTFVVLVLELLTKDIKLLIIFLGVLQKVEGSLPLFRLLIWRFGVLRLRHVDQVEKLVIC